MTDSANQPYRTWANRSLIVAAVGIVVCLGVAVFQAGLLWHAYLFAFLACWLAAMGATGLLALGNLTGGWWARAGRPFYTALMHTLPLVAIAFIPIALKLSSIYPWANPDLSEELHFAHGKAEYLSTSFFLWRAVGYFVAWLLVAWLLNVVTRADRVPAETSAMRRAGAFSLVVLVPTTTFAAFDWSMSLEPEWYSSIYGAILTAGGVLAAHAITIIGLTSLWRRMPDEAQAITGALPASTHEGKTLVDVLNDLGNLTLAFVMVWAYFAFSQFLITWAGNLPSEIVWYIRRLADGWQVIALAVVFLNFAVPFLMLLSRERKRNPNRIVVVAVLLLVAYVLQMYWTVVPAFGAHGVLGHAANLAALAALGGLWLAMVCWRADRAVQRFSVAAGTK